MDIRAYFGAGKKATKSPVVEKGKAKKRPGITLSDDDDVIPESPAVKSKQKDKKKKRPHISSDSDEDDFVTKSAKLNNASKPTNSPASKPKVKPKETKKPALKEVKVADLFGKGPVHRTPIPKISKKTEEIKEKTEETKKGTELGVHNDDGFDQTLIQLDDEATVSPSDKKSDLNDSSNAKKSDLKDPPNAKKSDTKDSPTKPESVVEPKAEPQLKANYKIPHKPKGSSDKNRDESGSDRRNESHSSRDDDRRNRSGDRHRSDDRYGRDRSGDRYDSRHGRDNRNSDRNSNRNSDRSNDRNSERNRDRSNDRNSERNRDRSNDRNRDRSSDRNRNERSDRNSDRGRNDRSDRNGRERYNDTKNSSESKRDKDRRHDNRSKDRLPTPSPVKNDRDTLKSPAKKEENVIIEDEKSYAYKKPARVSRVDQKKAISEKVHGKKDFSMFIDGENKATDEKKKVTDTDDKNKATDEKKKVTDDKKKVTGDKNNAKVDKKKTVDVESDADMNETVEYGLTSPTADSDDHNDTAKSKTRKRKNLDTSESELTEEEKQERKRASSVLYKSYLQRSGPKNPGSKEVPEGTPTCLSGLAFLMTGVLDSLEREEVADIIKRCGGEVKNSLTGKVTHMICGEEAGPAKLAKAEKIGTTVLTEDGFLDLIRKLSGSKPSKADPAKIKKESPQDKKTPIKKEAKRNEVNQKKLDSIKTEKDSDDGPKKKNAIEVLKKEKAIKVEVDSPKKKSKYFDDDEKIEKGKQKAEEKEESKKPSAVPVVDVNSMSWVDKYKPTTLKQIIGQHGEASNVNKLVKWLSEWYSNRKITHPKPSPWAKDTKGGYYKAALLSGPPGVGKTTTVNLVCKELGFDTVEFNASDTRSKNLLKEHLTDLVSTNSLAGYVHGKIGKGAVTKKHVVIMDEVDGMAGNEDRGGMQELISLIKTTSVPIICMCNDKASQKMRSLVGNCFDLTYSKPKVEQIKAAMMTICFKEGIKIPPQSLQQMIVGANQDVRQILNLLSVWSVADKNMDADTVAKDSKLAHKNMKMGPWDVVRKVFSEDEHKTMSIHDKSDLFFHDYSLSPLFVQQNYVKVAPHCAKNDILRRFAEAADCISCGDLVDNKIRKSMAWSLLPLQAMYSSVLPGEILSGHMQGQIEFPSWLGQNSRTNKMNRMAMELHSHTGLSTTGSKMSIRLDYAAHIRDAVVMPLAELGTEGVPAALEVLQTYHLLREDLDSLLELTLWPGKRDPYAMVDSKVKAALTRAYNKEAAPLPYSAISLKKSRSVLSSGLDTDSEGLNLPGEDPEPSTLEGDEEEEDSDVEHDAMIKKTKKPAAKAKPASQASSSKDSKSKAPPKPKGKKK